ncbi:elastase-1 isoform X1 [Hydra vulgaris]|uniref:elastase-1 isoform X1 n=1 Tax=Hydra vulgaris TaxID=6087 RepID=UPI0001927A3F|nr:elastase-1 [Hydra vulgaris]
MIFLSPFVILFFELVYSHEKRGYSKSVCEDILNEGYCIHNKHSCMKNGRYNYRMYHLCKKSCGVCEKESCEDKPGASCNFWNALGYCTVNNFFFKSMKIKCKKTCGACDSSGLVPVTQTTPFPQRRFVFTTTPITNKITKTLPPKRNEECGKNKIHDARIIAGTISAPNSWIWQAAIYLYEELVCGGTLIAPNYIITAAHCVIYAKKEGITITLGEHVRDTNEGSEQEHTVENIIIHNEYNDSSLESDIAIIKLKKKVKINDDIGFACLPNEPPPTNATCYLTGWGLLTPGGISSNILNEAKMPIVSNKKCGEKNKNDLGTSKVTENMLCAGFENDNKVSGCHGDSGGPFVCKKKNSWVLHGVLSWGSRFCDASHRYTVFTKVFNYMNWINKNLK